MEDLIGKAHAYLDNKGCKSMGQQYTAFEIEKMLADFAQQQLSLLNIPVVSGLACKCGNQTFTHRHSNWIECTACNKIQVLQA